MRIIDILTRKHPRHCKRWMCGHNNKKDVCLYMHYNLQDITECRQRAWSMGKLA